jgi:hypothetical protein
MQDQQLWPLPAARFILEQIRERRPAGIADEASTDQGNGKWRVDFIDRHGTGSRTYNTAVVATVS